MRARAGFTLLEILLALADQVRDAMLQSVEDVGHARQIDGQRALAGPVRDERHPTDQSDESRGTVGGAHLGGGDYMSDVSRES